MAKRYLIITIFVVLSLIVIGVMQFKSLIIYYKKTSIDQLHKQAQIIGINLEKEYNEFEDNIRYRTTIAQFEDLLSDKNENIIIADTIKRFYAKYQHLIGALEIFDSTSDRIITKDKNNYFSFSPIKKNAVLPSLRNQFCIEQEGREIFYYVPIFNQSGEVVANLKITLNIPQFIKNFIENYYIGQQSWIWCLDENSEVIASKYSESSYYDERGLKVTKKDVILSNLNQQFEGTLEHQIYEGKEKIKVLSTFYPVRIFDKKIEIVLSIKERVLFGVIKEKIAVMTICYIILIVWMIFLFVFVIQRQKLAEAEKKKAKELFVINQELKNTQAQLFQSEKLASIGQLSAGIAHEINNPLGFITNNIVILEEYIESYLQILQAMEGLKKTIEDKDLDKAGKKVQEINVLEEKLNLDFITGDIENLIRQSKSGAERIKKIVQDLRTFARKDEGQMELNNVEEILDEVINIVWNEIKYTAELKKEYGGVPLVKCNAQKLGQVFINLLVNAAQAIKEKGEITVKTYSDEKHVCIEISDTGCGIPKENISKIFDQFFTTKEVGKGTGLGLSIGYNIIKQHKGEMDVLSEINKGTKFTVKLPYLRSKSEEKIS